MKPVLQALIIADHVYIDANTGKKVIAGTFSRLWFRRKPKPQEPVDEEGGRQVKAIDVSHVGSPYLYINLTDLRGKVPLTVRYVDLENNKVLLKAEFTVSGNDPLQNHEVVLNLPPLPTEKEGAHALELLSDDEPLGSLRILVTEHKDEEQEDEGD